MGFRLSILIALLVFNVLPIYALTRSVRALVSPARRRLVLSGCLALVLLINLPITIFWFRGLYNHLYDIPATLLREVFVPTIAWQSSALLFTLLLAPVYLVWGMGWLVASVYGKLRGTRSQSAEEGESAGAHGQPASAQASGRLLSRRTLLASGPGLVVPALTLGLTGKVYLEDDVDISPEISVPIAGLPQALDGLTIVQLSDLHAGPYIRRKEIAYWVSLANKLKPDLVVLTGDMIDRSLDSLPELLAGLQGLRPSLGSGPQGQGSSGVVAILGNHDISSDPMHGRGALQGGESVSVALQSLGIPTLRNEVRYLGASGLSGLPTPGGNNLALMGLDWVRGNSGGGFFAYHPRETSQQLNALMALVERGTPSVLLAHHPDTFAEVLESNLPIGLTLSGHTHGGGQVVFFHWAGHTYGLSSIQFKYVSGLFSRNGSTLYVNRGLGYFGVPIRINCPPEISRFKLVRAI